MEECFGCEEEQSEDLTLMKKFPWQQNLVNPAHSHSRFSQFLPVVEFVRRQNLPKADTMRWIQFNIKRGIRILPYKLGTITSKRLPIAMSPIISPTLLYRSFRRFLV